MYRIFGTEEDKVNCSFYFKIGACRHGERCSRLHMKPNFSQTLLLAHFYMPPAPLADGKVIDDTEHYEDFYDDVLNEMITFGEVEELVICENLGDHMFGNTYVKFATEEQAHKALTNLRGRYFCGRIVQAEYSPVTDFREGRCRQFDERNCLRGGYCNFLHLKTIPRFARRYLRRTRLRNRYRHPYGLHYQNKKRDTEDDTWPKFPIRGTSEERRRCIGKWNTLLDEDKKEGRFPPKKKPSAKKSSLAQAQARNHHHNNNNGHRHQSNMNGMNINLGMNMGGGMNAHGHGHGHGHGHHQRGQNNNHDHHSTNRTMNAMAIANALMQSKTGFNPMMNMNINLRNMGHGFNFNSGPSSRRGVGLGRPPPTSSTTSSTTAANILQTLAMAQQQSNRNGNNAGDVKMKTKSAPGDQFSGSFINPERLRMIHNG